MEAITTTAYYKVSIVNPVRASLRPSLPSVLYEKLQAVSYFDIVSYTDGFPTLTVNTERFTLRFARGVITYEFNNVTMLHEQSDIFFFSFCSADTHNTTRIPDTRLNCTGIIYIGIYAFARELKLRRLGIFSSRFYNGSAVVLLYSSASGGTRA